MEMLNRAIGDADAFAKMLHKVQRRDVELMPAARAIDPEIGAWNADVERKRAEKKARNAQAVRT